MGWAEGRDMERDLEEALGHSVGPSSFLAAVWPWTGHLPSQDPCLFLLYNGYTNKNMLPVTLVSEGSYEAQDQGLYTKTSSLPIRSWGSLPSLLSTFSSRQSIAEDLRLSLSQFTSRMAPCPRGPQVQVLCGHPAETGLT